MLTHKTLHGPTLLITTPLARKEQLIGHLVNYVRPHITYRLRSRQRFINAFSPQILSLARLLNP